MPNTIDKHILALWQQIIQQTNLGSAIGEFLELTDFDLTSKVATIRADSAPTAKAISPYLPILESAFESVLRIDIKIRLLVPEARVISDSDLDKSSFTNQGLGAPLEWNGLRFRSKSEMKIAQALDKRKVLYFPNARGRLLDKYQRVNKEADFLICFQGCWGILECDGEIYHQSAAKDHARDMVWNANGIWFIKRFPSTECYSKPDEVVDLFLGMLRAFDLQTRREVDF